MDFNLDKIAVAHFDGKGEKFVSIDLGDYRKFVSSRHIVRSSNIVLKKGDLQSVIPNVRKSYAGSIHASEFFISIWLKEGVSCIYEEVMDLLHAIRLGSSSDGASIQWGLTINARMEETVRVLILDGDRKKSKSGLNQGLMCQEDVNLL